MRQTYLSRRILPALSFTLFLSGCAAWSQLAAGPEDRLNEQVATRLRDPRLAGCHVGLAVYSLDRRQWLCEIDADRRFVPASNVKLVTAAAALQTMGPAFRTRTEVRFAGTRHQGAWTGVLTLAGGGDPLLATSDLDALVQGLKSAGMRRFAGNVVADDGRFDSVRKGPGWMWDDAGTDDGPPISALTLNLAHLDLAIRPASLGQPLVVRPEPFTGYGTVENRSRTAASGEPLDAVCRPVNGRDVITVSGCLAPGAAAQKQTVTITDPPLYAATQFAEAIGRAGIPSRISVGGTPAAGTVVASHDSAPLPDIIRAQQKESVNLIAEILLKHIGGARGGSPGTSAKGIAAEQAFLTQVGWQPETYRLVDGSGLSRYNLLSPRQLTQLLAYMDAQPATAAAYRSALPVAAVDGTLAKRFQALRDSRRLIAKTGTLSGVVALSGYVETVAKERLAFSMLINGGVGSVAPLRQLQDDVLTVVADWQR
jgi:PBP4 family serine-type D-alanyl-D-alanine carboxypeptidase